MTVCHWNWSFSISLPIRPLASSPHKCWLHLMAWVVNLSTFVLIGEMQLFRHFLFAGCKWWMRLRGGGLYLFLPGSADRTELDALWGTVRSEPLARWQAHEGIYFPPCSHPMASPPAQGDFSYCQPQPGCSLNHLKSKAGIRVGQLRQRRERLFCFCRRGKVDSKTFFCWGELFFQTSIITNRNYINVCWKLMSNFLYFTGDESWFKGSLRRLISVCSIAEIIWHLTPRWTLRTQSFRLNIYVLN